MFIKGISKIKITKIGDFLGVACKSQQHEVLFAPFHCAQKDQFINTVISAFSRLFRCLSLHRIGEEDLGIHYQQNPITNAFWIF
jgi:hypothetical protein